VEITVQFAARAIDAVRSVAAEEILPRFRSVVAMRKDDGSIVTEADLAAQDALVRRLRAIEALPVMAEEMPSHEQAAVFERGGRFWCLDPLDGSKNFSEAIPFFAVSVALMQDAQPLFGAVYDPTRTRPSSRCAAPAPGSTTARSPCRAPPRRSPARSPR
jgi:myo-inositol-1(or 4)-monophosphatase